MIDADERVIWVHGDQLEHNGLRVLCSGMTRAEVIAKIGRPTHPLQWVGTDSTETNHYPRGLSVSLVNGRLVYSTLKTDHYKKPRNASEWLNP